MELQRIKDITLDFSIENLIEIFKPKNLECFNFCYNLRTKFDDTEDCVINIEDQEFFKKTNYSDIKDFRNKVLFIFYINGKDFKEASVKEIKNIIDIEEPIEINNTTFSLNEFEILRKIVENNNYKHNKIITLVTLSCYKRICIKSRTKESNDLFEYLFNIENYFSKKITKKLIEINEVNKKLSEYVNYDNIDIFSKFKMENITVSTDIKPREYTLFDEVYERFQIWCRDNKINSKIYTKRDFRKDLEYEIGNTVKFKADNGLSFNGYKIKLKPYHFIIKVQ